MFYDENLLGRCRCFRGRNHNVVSYSAVYIATGLSPDTFRSDALLVFYSVSWINMPSQWTLSTNTRSSLYYATFRYISQSLGLGEKSIERRYRIVDILRLSSRSISKLYTYSSQLNLDLACISKSLGVGNAFYLCFFGDGFTAVEFQRIRFISHTHASHRSKTARDWYREGNLVTCRFTDIIDRWIIAQGGPTPIIPTNKKSRMDS